MIIDLERIKKEIGESLRDGNQTEFKKLMSLVNKIYRNLNKDKVVLWNKKYKDKIKEYNTPNDDKKGSIILPKEKKEEYNTPTQEEDLNIFA